MPKAHPKGASAGTPLHDRNASSRDFDQKLGAKLRAVRMGVDMSQTELARALGISFQQVQKCEAGRDRIAAGTLHKIGKVLGVHPGEFYDETAAPVGGVAELREAMSMAAAAQKIVSPSVRKHLVAFVEELADPA